MKDSLNLLTHSNTSLIKAKNENIDHYFNYED